MNTTNVDYQAKIDSLLKELNSFLIAGVQAQLSWRQGTPLISFSVRYMQNGKRHSLGVFNTYDGAVNALITHKYKHAISLSTKEINSRLEQIMTLSVERTAALLEDALTNVSSTAKDAHFSEQAKVDLVMMEHIYSNVSVDKFESGKSFDYFYQANENDEGQLYTITPKMVRAFYESMNRKAAGLKHNSTATHDTHNADDTHDTLVGKEQENRGIINQPEKHDELSDEEYNKLLGLDDPD